MDELLQAWGVENCVTGISVRLSGGGVAGKPEGLLRGVPVDNPVEGALHALQGVDRAVVGAEEDTAQGVADRGREDRGACVEEGLEFAGGTLHCVEPSVVGTEKDLLGGDFRCGEDKIFRGKLPKLLTRSGVETFNEAAVGRA
ncbi:MAG: hypothetical protein BWY86_01370 [Candidatus Aminicenantes bacterium ADurb.Bin508]|nr:MAG: hypothetical protein BWY86_01370 [Candidatus Aminicenantes bacterium ADurb.Bin508]